MHVVTTRRLAGALAASLVVMAGMAASASHPATASAAAIRQPTALSALSHLTVKGRAPMTGYSREQFGSAWEDIDHNGCDTRDDILRRDLPRVVYRAGTNGCIVVSGVLADPYTATSITYVRGHSRVDIDHVVALGDAWQTGAARWAASKRLALANDPLNLLAVDSSSNRQKGDADAATWLPANKAYRCAYVARQLAVKLKYALWATSAERGAMQRVLGICPTMRLPARGASPTVVTTTGGGGSSSGGTHTGSSNGACDPNYAGACVRIVAGDLNCSDIGHPVTVVGDDHYRLDSDGDGKACESYG